MANQEIKSVKSRDLGKPIPAILFYLHGFHVTVKVNFIPSSLAKKVLAKWHWPLPNKVIATKNYYTYTNCRNFIIPVALCNKKAVALCNNRPSHFVIALVALCNKLEMDWSDDK